MGSSRQQGAAPSAAPPPPRPEVPVDGTPEPAPDRGEGDLHDLRRGARVNLLGQIARAAHPAMLAVTTNLFGAEHWGLYVAAQAALSVVSRTALFGYDRALVYWLPRQDAEPALLSAVGRVALGALLISVLGVVWAAGALADLKGVPSAPWAVMALALAPLTLTELLGYAAAGVRRMEVLVLVRDVVSQVLFFVAAWLAYGLGDVETGLAWAFVASQWLACGVALAWCARLLPPGAWERGRVGALPRDFRRYAREMWGADLAISMLYRADALVLAAFVSPTVVGIYGIALQFGNTVRSLRGAFEPVVTAVASGLSSPDDRRRLRNSLTYATRMVLGFQLLPTSLTVCLGPLVLPLFGEGFEGAYASAVLLCVGWTLHGSIGLAGPVVMGFGKSRWTLVTAFLTLAALLVLLLGLIPWLGAEGAAIAVALAFGGQGLAHQLQARALVGEALFTRKIYATVRLALLAGLAAGASFLALDAWFSRLAGQVGSYLVFTALFLPSVLRTMRGEKPAAVAS